MAKEVQTPEFLEGLEMFGPDLFRRFRATVGSGEVFVDALSRNLATLAKILSDHGPDVNSIAAELKSLGKMNVDPMRDYVLNAIDNFESFLKNKDDFWSTKMHLLELVHPCKEQIPHQYCPENVNLLDDQWETIVGGILRMFVKATHSNRRQVRNGQQTCQVHCDQECPEKERLNSSDDFQTHHCYSPYACLKSLIFDPEC